MPKGRTEAFSDGVFAIAATLLVLEFRVPESAHTGNRELARALLHLWPSLLAFIVSFSTILVMWVNHHGLFNLMSWVDRRVLYSNALLLMMVTFLPFPTALLARHLNDDGANTAAVVYCGTFVIVNVGYHLLLTSATKGHLLRPDVQSGEVRKIRNALWVGSVVYVVATIIAFFHALTGVLLCSILWPLWARLEYQGQTPPGIDDATLS
jgi:uncharacterized membrane protein